MKIGVIGINHKAADMCLRERLAKSCLTHFAPLLANPEICASVLLSTCNRTEVYFSSNNLVEAHSYILHLLRCDIADDFDQKLYSFFGSDCFSHLCRVTAGLDSAILGETEIQGQVKYAYEQACKVNILPKALHYLFQKALMVGKKIRSTIPLNGVPKGIEQAIFQAGHAMLAAPQAAAILFVGASAINRKLLSYFNAHGIGNLTLCNRSEKAAQEFASKYQLKLLPWDNLTLWHQFDWIICGTKSCEHLIKKESLPRRLHTPKLLIDLGVPRNIDPTIAHPTIALWNIDQLNNMQNESSKNGQQMCHQADAMISFATHLHVNLFRQKERPQLLSA